MACRVHPTVDPVEAPTPDSVRYGALAQPDGPELLSRDHATLGGGKPRDGQIPLAVDNHNPPNLLNLHTFDNFCAIPSRKTSNVRHRAGLGGLRALIHTLERRQPPSLTPRLPHPAP